MLDSDTIYLFNIYLPNHPFSKDSFFTLFTEGGQSYEFLGIYNANYLKNMV